MLSGSLAWVNPVYKTSGSFSSIAGLSDSLKAQIVLPSKLVPIESFSLTKFGYKIESVSI